MGCAAAVSCYLRDGACFFVCANPVAELPRLLVLGVLIGVLPALGATILLLVQDVVEGGSRWRRVAPVLGALLLAIPGLALVFSIDGIFFWQRVLFGLIGPAVLAYMTWETAKIRSTQSATGILYVDFFMVIVGELVAKYLLLATALAF